MDESKRATTLDELSAAIVTIATSSDPYERAVIVCRDAMEATQTSDVAGGLWLLWGGLTDWAENKPEEEAEAHAAMRRAAAEWARVKDEPGARDEYLDRWLYDVIGYERPARP